ncbi:MAG: tetratricopeptide repeat protein [Okeania sp. SIO1H4]|nr:tetratricopeptide repeat protein [Okeania sp. SIO1H4]NET21478.1 tetratricopeptide repeat protein [Okeania sp. SIO1H5]
MVKPVVGEIKPAVVAQQSGEVEEFKGLFQQAGQLSKQGKYSEAILLLERALIIVENAGASETTAAIVIHLLGLQHYYQGKYTEALPLFQRSLAILEKALGADHPSVAASLNNLAVLYRDQGNYTEALPLFQRSLAILEKALGANHPEVAQSLNNLAQLYQYQGNYSQALPLFQRSLAINEKALGADHPEVASSLNNLAGLYRDQGNYTEALPLLQRSLAIKEKALGANHLSVALSLNNLAGLYRDQGNYTEALPLLQRSLAIKEKALGANHLSVALSFNNLASLYSDQGKYTEALPLLQRSLATYEKALGANHPDFASSLSSLASLYSDQGKYTEALPLLQRSLATYEKALGTDHPSVAASLNNLALLYQEQGKYTEALPLLQRSLATYEKALGTDHPSVAASLNNLASLYSDQGKYTEALPLLQRSLATYEKALGANHPSIVTPLSSLALLYHVQGKYSEALPLFQRSLVILEKALGADHPDFATSLSNLASLYQRQGNYSEAWPLFQRSLAIREKALGADHPSVATSLNGLASLHLNQGNYTEALPLLQRSLAIREKALGTDHPSVATSLNGLALLYHLQGKYTEALPLFQRSRAIREKGLGADHPYVATSLLNLATLYQAQGNTTSAIEYLTQAMEVQETTLTTFLATGSESQKQASMRKLSVTTHQTISLHLQDAPNNPKAANLALTTILRRKGRILDSTIKSLQTIRDKLTPENQKLLNDLANTRTQLAALIYNKPENLPPEQYRQQVATLKGKAEKLEADLSLASAEFAKTNEPVTIETVQKLIPADAALVEIMQYYPVDVKALKLGKPHYAVYILHSTGSPQWLDLGPVAPIHNTITEFRAQLSQPNSSIREVARTLDQQVMQPIRQKLGNVKHTLLSPDSQLNLIPFAALVDENNQYLIQNYNITYLTTGRDLIKLGIDFPTKQPPILVANPEYDNPGNPTSVRLVANNKRGHKKPTRDLGSFLFAPENLTFGALSGTKAEVEAIAPMLSDVTLLTESNATENAIKQVNAPEILHIATHGFFLEDLEEVAPPVLVGGFNTDIPNTETNRLENPLLRSGIALAGFNPRKSGDEDGVMTALEIANLSLGGTKLVVLSACDTGVGDVNVGEGVYGLRRALALAGSESQVISLWQVDDFGTKDLMVKYYQRVLNNEGRSEALRQTQLEILGTEEYQHPYYWASFIPSGDWREINDG